MADHQPIKQHPNPGEALLHGRCRVTFGEDLDVSRHMHRLDTPERGHAVLLAPGEELGRRLPIGGTGIGIADMGGEELQKADGRTFAGVIDHPWQSAPGRSDQRLGRPLQLTHVGSLNCDHHPVKVVLSQQGTIILHNLLHGPHLRCKVLNR